MSASSPASRWMSPPPIYDTHSTTLKPYLELKHLLSLTWLAYPILSLLFVAFRLQISSASAQDAVANAKGDLLTSCKAAEQAATAAASMPRYMAAATNQQFAEAVNGTMNAARATLVLSLTVMEGIINFIVDIYRSTFLCFLELVVRGGLAILIGAVQELNSFVQTTANGIRTSIQNDINTANSAIQSAIGGVNKVNPFGKINVPQFDIPSLNSLQNITLPTDFEDALTKLNGSLPSLQELKDKVEQVIDTPFELLKKDINDTFDGLSFDPSGLPVPAQNALTFCGQMDTSVVDDLGHDLLKAAKIGIVIIILSALLLLAANCALEWYKWRCLKRHLQYTREAWLSDPTIYHQGPTQSAPSVTLTDHNLLMLQANSSHPLLTRIANNLARRLRLSASQHIHLQWFLHYIFHPPALACLLIGLFGLLSVEMQLWAVGPLAAKYSHRAASSISDFSNTITTSVNNNMFNQSATYANDVNGRVDVIQSHINDGVFGWVNSTTSTLNQSVVAFYDDIQNAVSTVFNGTILESPAQEFVRCIIGSKVDAIENALTFLHDNLKVDMPRVNQSVLLLSPESVNEATKPIAAAAIGGGNGDDEGLIGRLVNTYVASLKKERVMFSIFMGLWGFVVLMGLCVIFWHSYGQRFVEARRKRKWQKEQRAGISDIVVPFRGGLEAKGGQESELPSFTPLPSPKRGFSFFNRSTHTKANSNGSLDDIDSTDHKSYNSSLKHEPVESIAHKPISAPMRLMAIGRKAMGKEKFVGDGEKTGDTSPDDGEAKGTSWFSRVKGLMRQREEPAQDSSPTRTRPTLRITVDEPTDSGVPAAPTYDSTARDYVPPSAWSASPDPLDSKPWVNHMLSAKSDPSRLRPARRKPSVPSDVGSTYTDSIPSLPWKPAPLVIPPPRRSERHLTPSGRNSPSPPPSRSPVYQTQYAHRLRPPQLAPRTQTDRRSSTVPSSTPVTRLLTTVPARKSSAINPFATPFDDDAAVPLPTRPANVTNPFEAI